MTHTLHLGYDSYPQCRTLMAVDIPGYKPTKEAAEHLGISVQSLRNAATKHPGELRPEKVGHLDLWPVAMLDAYRAAHPARRRREGNTAGDDGSAAEPASS